MNERNVYDYIQEYEQAHNLDVLRKKLIALVREGQQ